LNLLGIFIFYFFLLSYILHTHLTGMEFFKNVQESPSVVCVYFACLLVLIVLCVYHLNKLSKGKEHYTGVGLGHGGGYDGATSGATQRTLAQEFSGTNQEDRSIISNAEVANLDPVLSQVGRPVDIFSPTVLARNERLVNERGEPDFWEIGSELAAYKQSQVRPMTAEANAKAEHFRGRREQLLGDIGNLEVDRLSDLLNQ
jgi:hypothetical protein